MTHRSSDTPPDPRTDRTFYLPRLGREYYQGDAVVHWTLTTFDRAKGGLNSEFHHAFRELLLHAAAREGLLCPIYCLMPDHMHIMWMGLRLDTDQLNGMAFLRTRLKRVLSPIKLQHQPHDSVLRENQRKQNAFAKVCSYIADNPVRANLVTSPKEWPFTGCVVPGYPDLHPLDGDYWRKFWRCYTQMRHPDAGAIQRPPLP